MGAQTIGAGGGVALSDSNPAAFASHCCMQWAEYQRRSVSGRLYLRIAVAIASGPKWSALCQILTHAAQQMPSHLASDVGSWETTPDSAHSVASKDRFHV